MSDQIFSYIGLSIQYVYMIGAICFFALQFWDRFKLQSGNENGNGQTSGNGNPTANGGFNLQDMMKSAMSNLAPMMQQMQQEVSGVAGIEPQKRVPAINNRKFNTENVAQQVENIDDVEVDEQLLKDEFE